MYRTLMLRSTCIWMSSDSPHLLLLLGFGVYLGQQGRDLTLLHSSMDVQDGLVASTEQGLVFQQVQQVQLGIEVGHGWHWQMPTA